jgi:hypothetical protein
MAELERPFGKARIDDLENKLTDLGDIAPIRQDSVTPGNNRIGAHIIADFDGNRHLQSAGERVEFQKTA